MRSDMSKVLVERPRWAHVAGYPRAALAGPWRSHPEDAPLREGMGRSYGEKSLNENLRPLVRFLHSRVGRPWSKVRAEIAANLSCSSAVQKHVLDHMHEYVHEGVRIEGKVVIVEHGRRWRSPPSGVVSWGSHWEFYVCPRTGLLRLAPPMPRRRRYRQRAITDPDRRILARDRELRRVDGVWYELVFGPVPRAHVDIVPAPLTRAMRASPKAPEVQHVTHKRQLGKRDILRRGLREDR